MPTRAVDVIIKGKNLATAAFKDARGDLEKFSGKIGRMLGPLNLLKGAIAALGVASLGALFKKATEAALAHEKGLGRNVETLDRLKAAWDFVLVSLGRALLGMDKGGNATNMFVDALAGMGNWIEQNKGVFQEFLGIVTKIASVLGMAARGIGGLVALARGKGLQAAAAIIEGSGGEAQASFAKFQRERKQIEANKEAERLRKEAEAEAKREWERTRKEFEAKIVPMMATETTGAVGTGRSFIGLTGEGPASLSPIGDPAALDVGVQKISELQLAIGSLDDSIRGVAKGAIVEFADAWADATQEMIAGSGRLGDAIIRAGRRAVGGVLMAKGRETLLDAAKAAIQGFTNPTEFLRAARLFAIGTAQMAAGQLFAGGGGGGGGGGGLGAAGFAQQRDETSDRGEATIVVQGGLLDMSDPRQANALADAIAELSGRRVIIVGGTA